MDTLGDNNNDNNNNDNINKVLNNVAQSRDSGKPQIDLEDLEDLGTLFNLKVNSVKYKFSGHDVSYHYFDNSEREDLQQSLLQWYDRHHRILPWRQTTPTRTQTLTKAERMLPSSTEYSHLNRAYAVWISEVCILTLVCW